MTKQENSNQDSDCLSLLIAVVNEEELLEEIITGWIDIGITGATVMETTDLLQVISYNIPIFAGFRSLSEGGMRHNKTIFTAIEDSGMLNSAIEFLIKTCDKSEKPGQGVYFVAPLTRFGRLGPSMDPHERKRHVEKKLGIPVK